MEPTSFVVAADEAAPFEFELDACALAYNATSVEAAFLFPESASSADLRSALATIVSGLNAFAPVAGRMVKRKDKMWALCNNAGVPFTHEKSAGLAPSLGAPVAAEFFDLAKDWAPQDEDQLGEPPFRVKVTDFADGQQLLAISMSHGLLDAKSLGMLMTAWSAAFRGQAVATVTHDHSVVPPMASFMPLTPEHVQDIPDTYHAVWRPFVMANMKGAPYECAVTTYSRSSEACKKLKSKYAKDGSNFSTNDVLCGEVAELLDFSKVSLLMEWRETLGVPNYFGVALTSIDVVGESPASIPSTLRAALPPLRNSEFVKWRLGAGASDVSNVLMNSWARAFNLADLRFKSAAVDVMLGQPMCEARARGFSGMGFHYALVLPQLDGVKVCLWATKEASTRLEEGVLSCVGVA